jgi:hypothetical protein
MIRRSILLIGLLIAACAAAEEKPRKPLLRDGFVLMGIDGKLAAPAASLLRSKTTGGDKWFFELERDISDGRNIIAAGSRIEMLPSAGLEKMVADMKDNPGRSYRLYNAMVTMYGGENYLFCDYFMPLLEPEPQSGTVAEANAGVGEKPSEAGSGGAEPNEGPAEVMINEPNDAVMIPQEIIDRLATRRIIRPESTREGLELKQDSILSERTGFIKEKPEGGWVFLFDAVGRNTSSVSLELLPCQVLANAQHKAAKAVGRARFKVSGIVTKYQGKYYLLLQTANRAYGHGNFGG